MNKLYYGDNLDVLRRFVGDETVALCYIDPPFNSKRNYNQIYNNVGTEDKALAQAFVDTWTWDDAASQGLEDILQNRSGRLNRQTIELINGLTPVLGKSSLLAYIVSMTLRIAEIHRVLKATGSFYLHCDPTASHYLKLVSDAIFCASGGDFKNEIIWRRTGSHNKTLRYGPVHDVIFFYTKSDKYTWNSPKRPYMREHVKTHFIKDDKGYRTNYYGNVLTGSGVRGGESGMVWRGFDPTAKGRHWAIPKALLQDLDEDFSEMSQHQKLDRLYELGLITITPGQAWPNYEYYLKPTDGQFLSDVWAFQPYTPGTLHETALGIDEDVRWLSSQDRERLGYPTQKPEGLLKRIIEASSKEGDVILDAYCGCGTTVAVAQALDRQWIGIDITYQSISLILKRLEDTYGKGCLANVSLSGVPEDFASAVALANKEDDRVRKEFEKWMVLTYSTNRAVLNLKKGGDGGIDGVAYFLDREATGAQKTQRAILSVKSNKTLSPAVVRDLFGTMEREKAPLGYLLTLYSMPNLVKESKKYGQYHNALFGQDYDRIEVISVEDLLKGARLPIPLSQEVSVLKKAAEAANTRQLGLF